MNEAKQLAPQMVELDTRQRIIEASIHLFGLKGFDGTSTREIARMAGVNIASLNYHFRSKQNLLQEVTFYVINDFRAKINQIPKEDLNTTADYAVKVYETLIADGPKCLNQFKMVLDAENFQEKLDPYPIGFEDFSYFFNKELHTTVPMQEKVWANNVILGYTIHMAVMSVSHIGRKHVDKYMPKQRDSIPLYVRQLAETLIRDLNFRFPA